MPTPTPAPTPAPSPAPAPAPAGAAPPARTGRDLLPLRPTAPLGVVVAVVVVAALAARVVPGERPGLGLAVLAAAVGAAVLLAGRPRSAGSGRRSRWQAVHGGAAVLLAGSAAVRDAGWVVALDVFAALLLGALALAPAGPVRAWAAVLGAPVRPLARLGSGTGWFVRGASSAASAASRAVSARRGRRPAQGVRGLRRPHVVPVLRAALLTGLLLVVFTPLLASADARFGSLLDRLLDGVLGGLTGSALTWLADAVSQLATALLGTRPDLAVARVVVFAVVALAVAAGLRTAWDATRPALRPERAARRPRPALTRPVEWLLPLAALDLLFAAFLAVRVSAPEVAQTPGATLAGQVHAGFAQLVVAMALVLGVVALAVRWTPMTAGPRTALALLCLLSLGLDAAALADLAAYVDAYGLTRLRVGVAVVCAGLAGLLVLLLVAGARWQRRRRQAWVPHAAVCVASACLLALTAADPDAAIARAQLARADADLPYVATLSADAAPAVADALREAPRALGAQGPCLLAGIADATTAQLDDDDEGWPSANASRARADRLVGELLGGQPVACP